MEVQINWAKVYVWLMAAQWAFNIGVAAWLYFRKSDERNARAIKAVATEVATLSRETTSANHEQNERLGQLETHMKHMPSKDEIANMRENVAATKARVDGALELLRRVDHQTGLIHEHLLRNH